MDVQLLDADHELQDLELQSDRTALMSLKLKEQQLSYIVPKLNCPFPHVIHPRAAAILEHTAQWLRKHEVHTLFADERAFQKFLSFKCGELPLMFHPTATLTRAKWISNLYTIFYILDDRIDDTPAGESPETSVPLFIEFQLIMFWSFPNASRSLVQNVLSSLTDAPAQRKSTEELFDNILATATTQPGTEYPGKLSPLASGFQELWSEAIGSSPADWGLRFAKEFQKCVMGMLQESQNRKYRSIPKVTEYNEIRRATGALHLVVGVCTGYVGAAHMPDEIYCNTAVQHLLDITNDATSWINDIFSLPKEVKKGEIHNLVWLLSHERNCSFNEAAVQVARMMEAACVEMQHIGVQVEKETPPQHRAAVVTLIQTCFLNISGFLTWHCTSPRYQF